MCFPAVVANINQISNPQSGHNLVLSEEAVRAGKSLFSRVCYGGAATCQNKRKFVGTVGWIKGQGSKKKKFF